MGLIYLFKCSHIRTVQRDRQWVEMICYEGVLIHHNRAFTFARILDLPQNMNFEEMNAEIRVLLPPTLHANLIQNNQHAHWPAGSSIRHQKIIYDLQRKQHFAS